MAPSVARAGSQFLTKRFIVYMYMCSLVPEGVEGALFFKTSRLVLLRGTGFRTLRSDGSAEKAALDALL